jgi:hypothetical protein
LAFLVSSSDAFQVLPPTLAPSSSGSVKKSPSVALQATSFYLMTAAARDKDCKKTSQAPDQSIATEVVSEKEIEVVDAERFHRGLWMVVAEEKRKVHSLLITIPRFDKGVEQG